MIIRDLIEEMASGEIARFVSPDVMKFCESFMQESISESKKYIQKLAFNAILKEFYINKDIRDRLIDVASEKQIEEMLSRAAKLLSFTEQQKEEFYTVKAYELLKAVFDICINDQNCIDYILGIVGEYTKESHETFSYIKRLKPGYEMYPYQLSIVSELEQLYSTKRKCLLHLPTGAGKTRTAINFICDFLREDKNRLVIWLADRNELCEQALSEFNKAWVLLGNTSITSYGYFGNTDLSVGGIDRGFLVCGVQSLWALKNSERDLLYKILAEKTSLVVFDEAHKAAANTYADMLDFILETSPNSKLLGLTATPGRKITGLNVVDDENVYLAKIFDNNKVTMSIAGYLSPIQYLFEKNYLATPAFFPLDYSDENVLVKYDGKLLQKDAINALSESEKRNRAILNCVLKEIDEGSFIIVFASNVEHARNLEGLFQLYDVSAMSIDSQTKDREIIIRLYRNKEIQVLINYDVLTAGFDAPHTNVAIIARPTSSLVAYSQMAGRAMRGGEFGNKTCKIYTVNDDIPEFNSVAMAFVHWDKYWVSVGQYND